MTLNNFQLERVEFIDFFHFGSKELGKLILNIFQLLFHVFTQDYIDVGFPPQLLQS